MKIAIFGATGRVGSKVLEMVVHEGWEVHALIRDRSRTPFDSEAVQWYIGDATSPELVDQVIKGCDLVFSGLNTDKTDTLSQAIPLIIHSMQKHQISRIVTIGTAGILDSRYEEGKYRFQTSESKRKSTFAAEEHLTVYQTLKNTDLRWTIICPTYLPDGEEQGNVRHEMNVLPEEGKKITVGDTARFAFHTLLYDQFVHNRVGICY
ncbi:NAD(P)-dependent oxidoreductase [Thalassobacillus hwangdonensis]|uniref:NAD(P)-dependent oxidoreductase n=1 Tax=Thalassobacillus hwangdonensis TaxID=546108 RepID=A0ABW3KZH9_9BACI